MQGRSKKKLNSKKTKRKLEIIQWFEKEGQERREMDITEKGGVESSRDARIWTVMYEEEDEDEKRQERQLKELTLQFTESLDDSGRNYSRSPIILFTRHTSKSPGKRWVV